jgi:hypothetical protein
LSHATLDDPVTHVVDVVEPGGRFAPDPLMPGRQRWWDSWRWTARVVDPDGDEGLHWTPELPGLPRPAAPAPPVSTGGELDRVTTLAGAPLEPGEPHVRWWAADPMLAAFGDDLRPFVPEAIMPGSSRRRIVTAIGAAAAAALIALGAAAGAGVFTPSSQRPSLASELAYRDTDAGFSLRYPDDWRVLRRERGNAIRFAIAAPGAPTTETNTVSVVVGTSAADLPALHSLANQLTEMLRQQLPGVRLELAARSRVADAPGFRFAFRDPDSSPATRIEQYVGRTANGRPLTVTVTVREPRTAPTETELNDLLASLRSGQLRARP